MLDSSSHYESLFHAASVDLLIPEISRFPSQPSEDVESWWTEVERVKTRTIAFLGTSVLAQCPSNLLKMVCR